MVVEVVVVVVGVVVVEVVVVVIVAAVVGVVVVVGVEAIIAGVALPELVALEERVADEVEPLEAVTLGGTVPDAVDEAGRVAGPSEDVVVTDEEGVTAVVGEDETEDSEMFTPNPPDFEPSAPPPPPPPPVCDIAMACANEAMGHSVIMIPGFEPEYVHK